MISNNNVMVPWLYNIILLVYTINDFKRHILFKHVYTIHVIVIYYSCESTVYIVYYSRVDIG